MRAPGSLRWRDSYETAGVADIHSASAGSRPTNVQNRAFQRLRQNPFDEHAFNLHAREVDLQLAALVDSARPSAPWSRPLNDAGTVPSECDPQHPKAGLPGKRKRPTELCSAGLLSPDLRTVD
jgi:hypothetical protein